jgi:hypothetical protein
MASSASSPSIFKVRPEIQPPPYQPKTLEARRALDVVRGANASEHLCCYTYETEVAEIGYWRRGLTGPSYFVALGSGKTLDAAVIAAARKITNPLTMVEKPTAAQMDMRELVEICAVAMCPLCAGRMIPQNMGAISNKAQLAVGNPETAVYWHHYLANDQEAERCVASLLRSQAELFIRAHVATE